MICLFVLLVGLTKILKVLNKWPYPLGRSVIKRLMFNIDRPQLSCPVIRIAQHRSPSQVIPTRIGAIYCADFSANYRANNSVDHAKNWLVGMGLKWKFHVAIKL